MKRSFSASLLCSYSENLPSKGSIFREKVSIFEISYRKSTTKSDTFGRSQVLGSGWHTVDPLCGKLMTLRLPGIQCRVFSTNRSLKLGSAMKTVTLGMKFMSARYGRFREKFFVSSFFFVYHDEIHRKKLDTKNFWRNRPYLADINFMPSVSEDSFVNSIGFHLQNQGGVTVFIVILSFS